MVHRRFHDRAGNAVGAGCGDDGGSNESQTDDVTDEVTNKATLEATDDVEGDARAACEAVGEYVAPAEVAEAFGAELQPAEAIDGNGVCLVQLDVGVVAIAVEPYDSDADAADTFADLRDVVTVENPPEEVDVGDEAILVTGDVDELYVLSGSNLFLVGDTGSLELDNEELRDGFIAVAELMTDNA